MSNEENAPASVAVQVATEAAPQQSEQAITPEQAEFLGKKPVELVQLPDGSIATQGEVQRMIDEGHDRPQAGTPQ